MPRRSVVYRTIAILLLAALALGPAAAFGAPAATDTPPASPPPADQTPAAKPPAPTKQEPTSAIPAPVDEKTRRFREELARRQAALDALQTQLDALDRELEIATENYNGAVVRLEETKKRLAVTETDLANAQAAYEEQMKALEARIRLLYRGEDWQSMLILLEAKSVSDFVQRFAFLSMLGERDVNLAETLANQRDGIQQALIDLKDAKLEAEQLEFGLKARRIEIELRIQERQQMLAAAQSDLLALLGDESTRRQGEEAALLRAILSGASGVGITVTPGTPVETALAYHGVPYLWGGATPSGFDCSGLVLYVFAQHGVVLPHYSGSQFLLGTPVAPAALEPGDVVFFGSPIHHVGMYMGNDYFIHAPRTGDFVKVSRLSDRHDYAGARRYPWVLRSGPIKGVVTPLSQPSVPLTR